jgi:hypothetical protein
MAVVQISRIQVRRGQKNSGIGVPQLSSAEFAWAVDTQELFIGNGSVAEGAPAVGNTKILTEHDNILELAGSYRFAANDVSISNSVARSLQTKIDEIEVSVVDFGAVPDGSTDSTSAFAVAINQLFKNTNDKYKKVLKVPNGTYLFATDLYVPSGVIIRGENVTETVLEIGNNSIIFQDDLGKSREIKIENLTIDHQEGQTVISNSESCEFNNVVWQGNYLLGDVVFFPENANCTYSIPVVSTGGFIRVTGSGVNSTIRVDFGIDSPTFTGLLSALEGQLNADPIFNLSFSALAVGNSIKITSLFNTVNATTVQSNFTVDSLASGSSILRSNIIPAKEEFTDGSNNVSASVFWENNLFGSATTDIKFIDCIFQGTKLGIECQQTDSFDTHVYFKNCKFFVCDKGIYIGGVNGQGNFWQVYDTLFEEIANQAFYSTAGRGTQIDRCRFVNVGNNVNSSSTPTTSICLFGESFGNSITNSSSNRHQNASIVTATTTGTKVEFANVSRAELIDRNYSEIYRSDGVRLLCVLSADAKVYQIDYSLRLDQHVRVGRITLTVNTLNTDIEISDEYQYSGGGLIMTGFVFSANLADNDLDNVNDTILLSYINPVLTGRAGFIEYNYTLGV